MSDQFNKIPSQEENTKYTPEQQQRIKEIDYFVDSTPESWQSTFHDPSYGYWASDTKEENKSEAHKYLINKLEGKTVIDLGFGDGSYFLDNLNYRAITFKNLKIKKYIGIEKNFSCEDEDFESFKNKCQKIFNEGGMEADFEQQDMLKYIVRLPDESSNFIINGIDEHILPQKYWEHLAEEIYKKTEPKGIITGLGSLTEFFLKNGFKIIEPKNKNSVPIFDFFILEKEDQ